MVADSAGDNFHLVWSHDYIFYRVSSQSIRVYVILTRKEDWTCMN